MKVRILSYIAFFCTFLIIWVLLDLIFEKLENPFKGMISAGIAAVLAPRVEEYEAQSKKKMQLKWIFLKKAISL